jgi:hypothetical protein
LEFEEVLERDKECEKELTAHTLTLISPTTPSIKSFPDYLTHSLKKQEGKKEKPKLKTKKPKTKNQNV